MTNAYLRTRLEERAQIADLVSGVLDKAAEAQRDITDDEQKLLDKWEARAADLDNELKRLEAQERGTQAFQSLVGRIGIADEREERRDAQRREQHEPEERKSFGDRFIESDAFKAYRGRGSSGAVEFEGFLETRAAILSTDLNLPAQYWAGPEGPSLTSPLLDVLGREPVSTNAVSFTVWPVAPEAGGPIPEAELKPEATLQPAEDSATLGTYAHWKAISRQALEDAPRIRAIVEGKLRQGLLRKLESVATGVLLGGTYGEVVNADLLAGARIALGDLQGDGYAPNAMLLNPADFANLDIAAADAAGSGPTAFGNYWGLRPIGVPGIPVGQSYVGDFGDGITWFDRNVSSVYLTDTHADYFVRNLLVLLAETRAAFAVTDPNAIRIVSTTDLTPLAASSSSKSSK